MIVSMPVPTIARLSASTVLGSDKERVIGSLSWIASTCLLFQGGSLVVDFFSPMVYELDQSVSLSSRSEHTFDNLIHLPSFFRSFFAFAFFSD